MGFSLHKICTCWPGKARRRSSSLVWGGGGKLSAGTSQRCIMGGSFLKQLGSRVRSGIDKWEWATSTNLQDDVVRRSRIFSTLFVMIANLRLGRWILPVVVHVSDCFMFFFAWTFACKKHCSLFFFFFIYIMINLCISSEAQSVKASTASDMSRQQ